MGAAGRNFFEGQILKYIFVKLADYPLIAIGAKPQKCFGYVRLLCFQNRPI